jgi:hypothetical protein
MVRVLSIAAALFAGLVVTPGAEQRPTPDSLPTSSGGDVIVVPIVHATLRIEHGPNVILVDPPHTAATMAPILAESHLASTTRA